MKAQFIFYTPVGILSSDFMVNLSDEDITQLKVTAKSFATEGKYVSLAMEGGGTMFIPQSIMRNSVVIVKTFDY